MGYHSGMGEEMGHPGANLYCVITGNYGSLSDVRSNYRQKIEAQISASLTLKTLRYLECTLTRNV